MIEADLSSQLPGSRRDVDRLGGGVRGLVHRPDKRIRIIHAVAGLCTLVVGDADSVSRTLNLRQRLLKLNEVALRILGCGGGVGMGSGPAR